MFSAAHLFSDIDASNIDLLLDLQRNGTFKTKKELWLNYNSISKPIL